MNKLAKISIFLIVVFTAGILQNPLGQSVSAQLEPIENITENTISEVQKPDDKKNTMIKEALANIFEVYQTLGAQDKTDVNVMLKLNNIEKILIQMMQ
ncbi:MAG TPA: hypothetical protein VER14_01545 [Phototrophicaceae bacterium]|nr:hypothetical protein [Phototrophicaceae bacterium]